MYFFFYEIIILCFIPFALAKLFYRGLIKLDHLKYLNERFAIYSKEKKSIWQSRQTVWFHCVSVGETKAVFTLIEILLKRYPKTYFLISHGTLTGRNTKLPNSPRIHRTYLPYDTKGAGKRFLFYYQPKVGLILETELWFNLINQCRFHKIPLHLINARLSKNSLNKYLPFKEFINSGLLQLNSIFVRAKEDLDNFSSLTEANIEIMGNIKFEARPPKGIQKKINQLKKGVAPIYEPGLEELIQSNCKQNRLSFTSSSSDGIQNSNIYIIAVGTPMGENGDANLEYVFNVAKSIGEQISERFIIINKSTVPVGTAEKVNAIITNIVKERGINCDFSVVSNPEFLKEGDAIRDFM